MFEVENEMAKSSGSHRAKKAKANQKIKFDYLKTAQFRNFHVDGAVGGLAPNGNIQMAIYSERPPIPQQTTQIVNEKGFLAEEILKERKTRDAVIRDLEANLIIDVNTAAQIVKWLQDKINQFVELQEKAVAELEIEEGGKDG